MRGWFLSASSAWQHERFADLPQRDALCFIFQRRFESFNRLAHRFEAQPESLMMHRHDKSCAGIIRHLDCLLRSAMRLDPRIVGGNRKDREINAPMASQFFEVVGERGIAGEKDPMFISFDQVTVVPAMIVGLHTRTPVLHADRGDSCGASVGVNRCGFAPMQFGDFV